MALTKEKKQSLVAEYSERLDRADVAIWSNYRGVKVAQLESLRNSLRQTSAEVVIVKNTLMRVALEEHGLPYDHDVMNGPCAVTFVYDDIAAATRVVNNFARDSDQRFQLVGGLVGGKIADAAQVRELMTLPSREVLLARVVGGIAAPISAFVGTLSAVIGGLVNVLNAHREKLEEGTAG